MPNVHFDLRRRLEPAWPFGDLESGMAAPTADAAWFLGRQWQLGEHQGEDAATPVKVTHRTAVDPVDPHGGDTRWDPALVPPEAVIESEHGDWWTPARRLRIGLAAVSGGLPTPDAVDPSDPRRDRLVEATVGLLPAPFGRRFEGRAYDGQLLHQHRAELRIDESIFAEVPTEPTDLWDPTELSYSAEFSCAGVGLHVRRHDGHRLDWYSVDADGPVPAPTTEPDQVTVYPGRMVYPGGPHPRWWQIEDAALDMGGFGPDVSHFATMLLVDLMVSHGDNWFTFPIDVTVGSVATLRSVEVTDSFDDTWQITAPTDWSMFRVRGLDPASLLVWPTIDQPLSGPPLENVTVGIDEDANLLWAVEQRVEGEELDPSPPHVSPTDNPDAPEILEGSAQQGFVYRPMVGAARHWHPYQLKSENGHRRFVQARLSDLSGPGGLMPEPTARVLDPPGAIHEIEPATVPWNGLRLQRQWRLVRQTDGVPVLWVQRDRSPLLAPPISGHRFDVFEPTVVNAQG